MANPPPTGPVAPVPGAAAPKRGRVVEIAIGSYTNAGEGASASTVLRRDGSFRSRQGGDIGSGFDVFQVVEGSVRGQAVSEIFALADRISGKSPGGPPNGLGSGSSLKLTLDDKRTWRTENLKADGDFQRLAQMLGQATVKPVLSATAWIEPTDRHPIYAFEVDNQCPDDLKRRYLPPPRCAGWPSKFFYRTDGTWQCQQARAVAGGVEMYSAGGSGARWQPPRLATGIEHVKRSMGAHTWKVVIRGTKEIRALKDPRQGAKAWRGVALQLSPYCWPLEK